MTAYSENLDLIEDLTNTLNSAQPTIAARESRYNGRTALKFAATDVPADLKRLNVNLCALAVDSLAERMRVSRVNATARGVNVNALAQNIWLRSNLDQLLNALLVDAMALGSAYMVVWGTPPVITIESAKNVAVKRNPITGQVTAALKRWQTTAGNGAITAEWLTLFTMEHVTVYRRAAGHNWDTVHSEVNPTGLIPVIPLVNIKRVGDMCGYSVIDDLADLNDALNKTIADMLTASEDVARPRRWATGVDLEEGNDTEGFTADGFTADATDMPAKTEVVSPFADGNRMFTVENPEAKFGQLAGADLKGYQTAVDIILQQIMAVSALPAHMVGVTTSNPSSADAIRAAEAGLTSRAESRIAIFGIAIENALKVAIAMARGVDLEEVDVILKWSSAATRSIAQEADAVTKLHTIGVVNTDEARTMLGMSE